MTAGKSDGTAVKVAVIGGIVTLLAAAIGIVPVLLDDDDDGGAGPTPPTTSRDVSPTTEPAPTTTTSEPPTPTTTAPAVVVTTTTPAPSSSSAVAPVQAFSHEELDAALVTTADLPPGFQEVAFSNVAPTWADANCAAADQAVRNLEAAVPQESFAVRELWRVEDASSVLQTIMVMDDPDQWLDANERFFSACDGIFFTLPNGITGVAEFIVTGHVPTGADRSVSADAAFGSAAGTQVGSHYNVVAGDVVSSINLSTLSEPYQPVVADPNAFADQLTSRLPG